MFPEAISGFEEFLAAHAALLKSLHIRAQAARWNVSYQEFAAALHRSAAHHFGAGQPTAQAVEDYLRALHLEDLALACALRRASEPAWEQFVADYRPVLRAAARAIVGAGGEERARELADSLYAELYGLDRSGGTRKNSLLDYFHGRSKLSTWLRSVLAQRYVDGLRASQRSSNRSTTKIPADDGVDRITSGAHRVSRKRMKPRPCPASSIACRGCSRCARGFAGVGPPAAVALLCPRRDAGADCPHAGCPRSHRVAPPAKVFAANCANALNAFWPREAPRRTTVPR